MLDQDVQSRVDAYRGDPQALQQKYSVSKDLLDLMALQKLTKEKESAARELQMAMAAQQGQGAGTIKDQLQQKALGMTKMELEKQQMALLQQKQQQQQQNMQQLAQSGIAQNPAPNMEAAPGFASGGIIAFAGPDGSQVPFANPISDINVAREKVRRGEPLTEREENALRNAERAMIRAFGPNQNVIRPPAQAPTPLPTDLARQAEKKIPLSEAEKVVGNIGRASAPGYNGPNPLDEKRALSRGMQLPPNAPTAYPMPGMTPREVISDTAQRAGIPSRPASAETRLAPEQTRPARPAPAVAPVGIATPPAAPPAPQAAPPAPPVEAAAQQSASQTAGLATLPQAAAAPSAPAGLTNIPLGNQRDESGNLLSPEDSTIAAQAARKIMSMLDGTENPKTAAQEIREGFKSEYALTEEEKRDRKQYQDMLRARHATLSDPEDIRREKLKQTLLGMAGASNAGIALARGAATGQNYEAGRNAEALKTLSDLNDIGEKEISARRAGALKGFELAGQEGQNVRTSSTAAQTAATNAIVNMMGFDAADERNKRELASREKVANAEIMARKDIAGWDNQTKMAVVNATNQMHRDVQQMAGQVQRDVAGMQTASHERVAAGQNASRERASAGDNAATMGAAQLGRTARLEEAIINNRARLMNVEENAMKAIDAAASKERASLMALMPSTGLNAAQKKQLDAIDAGTVALKADLRARMNQQISDLGLENVLGPSPLKSGQNKGLGGYTVTREPTK
jgi:hypothetical protein